MSYEIIYGKQFIDLGNGEFVPMIITGSNNCYESTYNNRQRRTRDWHNFQWVLNGKHFGTLETMLKNVESERQGYIDRSKERENDYDDKSFGYFSGLAIGGKHTSGTTFGMYKGLFVDGCKKANTIEELNENCFNVNVRTGYIYKDKDSDEKTVEAKVIYVNNAEELKSAIIEMEQYVEGTKISVIISVNKGIDRFFSDRKRQNIISRQENKKEKVLKKVSEYFIFNCSLGYFVKGTKNGYKYCGWLSKSYAKKLYSKKAAETFCKKLNERYAQTFEVETVKLEESILV